MKKRMRRNLSICLAFILTLSLLSVSTMAAEPGGFGGIPDGRYTYVNTEPTAETGSGLGQVSFDYWTREIRWAFGGNPVSTGSAVLTGDELQFFQGLYISDLPVTDWFGAGPKNTEGYAGDVSGNFLIDFTAGKLSRFRVDAATTNVVAIVTKDITAPTLEVSGMTRGQPNLLQSRITIEGSTNGLFLTMQGDVILNHITIGHNAGGVGLKSDKIGGDTFIVDTVTVDGTVEWLNHGAVILPLTGRPGLLETNGQDITITGNFVGRVGKDLTLSTGAEQGGNITIGAELSSGVAFVNGIPTATGAPSTMTLSLGGKLIAGKGDVVIGTNTEGPIVFEMIGDIVANNVTIKPTTNGEITNVGKSIGNITAAGDIDIVLGSINEANATGVAVGELTSQNGDIKFVSGIINGTVGSISAPNGTVDVKIESATGVGEISGQEVAKEIGASTDANKITALPMTSQVLVNGTPVNLEAYTINGNNYFKLRDIAYALNGTEKQFGVRWFGEGYITLIGGDPYEAVGGEMEGVATQRQNAVPARWTSVFNGKGFSMEAYYIDGEHYFKLRDMAAAANFAVDWNGELNVLTITTAEGYAT